MTPSFKIVGPPPIAILFYVAPFDAVYIGVYPSFNPQSGGDGCPCLYRIRHINKNLQRIG